MTRFESHGNGFTGRVDGPLFDARHILIPAAGLLTTFGEALQTDGQAYIAAGLEVPKSEGLVGTIFNTIATMPLDAKALGVSCAAAAAVQLVHAGRMARDIHIENSIISTGLSRESAVPTRANRFVKRVATTALTGVAGVAAYFPGEYLEPLPDLAASMGLIGAGVFYMMNMQRRVTGRW